MRFCALIEPDENLVKKIKGKPLILYQIEAFKRFGIEDIYVDRDDLGEDAERLCKELKCDMIYMEKEAYRLRALYDGIFFIGGDTFLEKDFLREFSPEHSALFKDYSNKEAPHLLFHIWEGKETKEYDITGKIWKNIRNDIDIFYVENKLSLLSHKKKLREITLFSFDLDGTTILGRKPIFGVYDFLSFLKKRGIEFLFLTNNSSKTNKMHAEDLSNILKWPVEEKNIMSSIDSLEVYLREKNIRYVYPFVNERVKVYLSQRFSFSEENPDVIVVGFNTDATYTQMYKVSELIFKGIPYLLIHPDLRCPTEFGYIPDAGSFGKMFELTTGQRPIWIGGKPNPIMVEGLIKKYDVSKEKIAYVGDRLYTDIEMAKKAGIYGFLVLTGESSLKDYYNYVKKYGENEKIYAIDNLLFLKAFLERGD